MNKLWSIVRFIPSAQYYTDSTDVAIEIYVWNMPYSELGTFSDASAFRTHTRWRYIYIYKLRFLDRLSNIYSFVEQYYGCDEIWKNNVP